MSPPNLAAVPPITPRRAMYVAMGGMVDSGTRWAVVEVMPPAVLASVPWALLLVNVAGTAILAAAIVASRRRPQHASVLVDGIGTGFCGGLTTFSAFAVATAAQLRAGEPVWAAASVVLMVGAGVAGALTSHWWAARRFEAGA